MRLRGVLLLLAACSAAGCRTEIAPVVKPDDTAAPRPGECIVAEYPTATQVPEQSTNLGWVDVEMKGDKETTWELLRLAVCALGGDAVSQLTLVRLAPGAEPSAMRANAWRTPHAPAQLPLMTPDAGR